MSRFKKAKQAKYASEPVLTKVASIRFVFKQNAKRAPQEQSPDSYKPIWAFRNVDSGTNWDFANSGDDLQRIITRLGEWEQLTWHEIKLKAKKKNHSLEVAADLTKAAQDRLTKLNKDPESVLALHIGNTKVLYGVRERPEYHILWYDRDHGDNDTCVCRSKKKHT